MRRRDVEPNKNRARSAQPYTLFNAMHKMTEDIRLWATVAWNDPGERVSLQEVAPEPGLSEDTQRKLKALLSPPAPSASGRTARPYGPLGEAHRNSFLERCLIARGRRARRDQRA